MPSSSQACRISAVVWRRSWVVGVNTTVEVVEEDGLGGGAVSLWSTVVLIRVEAVEKVGLGGETLCGSVRSGLIEKGELDVWGSVVLEGTRGGRVESEWVDVVGFEGVVADISGDGSSALREAI